MVQTDTSPPTDILNLASTLAGVPTDQVQATVEAEPMQIARIEPLSRKGEISTTDSSSSSSSSSEDGDTEEEVADSSAEIHLTGRGLFFNISYTSLCSPTN